MEYVGVFLQIVFACQPGGNAAANSAHPHPLLKTAAMLALIESCHRSSAVWIGAIAPDADVLVLAAKTSEPTDESHNGLSIARGRQADVDPGRGNDDGGAIVVPDGNFASDKAQQDQSDDNFHTPRLLLIVIRVDVFEFSPEKVQLHHLKNSDDRRNIDVELIPVAIEHLEDVGG